MKSYDEMDHHPTSEKMVEILCSKTQNTNTLFYRVLVAYYWAMVASMMRTTIVTHDRGEIPVNMYALNLSPSGTGKGFSTNIMKNEVTHLFRQRFLDETFPILAEQHLAKLATKRANRKNTDIDAELKRAEDEFKDSGELLFNFSDATTAAVRQMRHKLQMADAGAITLQVDEIGSNFAALLDCFKLFLELYDVGLVDPKLLMNTNERKRNEALTGRTPTNLLMFGTPTKLLDGAKTEEEFYSMLETGYARRCYFGYSRATQKMKDLTPEEVYTLKTNQSSDQFLEDLATKLENLGDIINCNRKLVMTKDTMLLLIEYQMQCEKIAETYPEHEEIRKAEISHRYFKALKLAGAYAFIDDSSELTAEHLYHAIKLAEESGIAFQQLLTRDRPYVKLAKYLADVGREVTQADLVEDLPLYRGSISQKQELVTLATAYGYNNNIIIKKSFQNGIEFLRGESLAKTDLTKLIISYSNDIAKGYLNQHAPWEQLHRLTQGAGLHWCAHHFMGGAEGEGHRSEENVLAGFNLAVMDIDGEVKMETVKLLLAKYKFMLYTTKRHTDEEHRFRLIMPMNYRLNMDAKEYKEFMTNLFDWVPFEVDRATSQRARKWLSHDGHYEYNEGELLDVLPFIPKTSKNEERKRLLDSQQSLDNLERWVLNNSGDGNRNNMLLRYAMLLLDSGFDFEKIKAKVIELNNKMPDKLDEVELYSTIFVTITKKMAGLQIH